jgi:hypothetical protein
VHAAPHHEGRLRAAHVDLILRSPPSAGVSKEEPQQDSTRLSIPATQSRPDFAKSKSLDDRGRRESRVLAAPAAWRAVKEKHTSKVTTGSTGQTRPSPRNGVTVSFVLSPVSMTS